MANTDRAAVLQSYRTQAHKYDQIMRAHGVHPEDEETADADINAALVAAYQKQARAYTQILMEHGKFEDAAQMYKSHFGPCADDSITCPDCGACCDESGVCQSCCGDGGVCTQNRSGAACGKPSSPSSTSVSSRVTAGVF